MYFFLLIHSNLLVGCPPLPGNEISSVTLVCTEQSVSEAAIHLVWIVSCYMLSQYLFDIFN